MLKILFISLCLISSNCFSFDLKGLVNKAKSKIHSAINGEQDKQQSSITLPKIPEVKKSATSVEVYTKKGKIYEQGKSFNKLKLEQKRKYRIAFIEELFRVTQDEKVNDNDLRKNLNMLEQGGTREGIYRSLVLSRDYKKLEAVDDTPSDALVNFTVSFGAKYLGRKFDGEIISRLNLWGIKRVLTEKTLELIDVLAQNENDLYRWYAVFSEELNKKYPSVWQSKTRKRSSAEYHMFWVKQVPFQQIKSEIIIKMHKTMNYLATR